MASRGPRILVLWADNSSANLGVRALAHGAGHFLTEAFGTEVLVDYQDFAGSESGTPFGKWQFAREMTPGVGPVTAKLSRYDLIFDTGAGDSLSDIYGWKRVSGLFYAQHRAWKNGIPLVLGPQTLGPFSSPLLSSAFALTMSRSKLVMARDSMSLRFAESKSGSGTVVQATDLVFAIPPAVPDCRADVLINVSGLLWNSNPHVDFRRYRSELIWLARSLLDIGLDVKFLAHVLQNAYEDNDVPAVMEAAQLVGTEAVVPLHLADARSVIAGSRLVIGGRFHACLNALSQGVPAIPMAYSRKFAPLLEDLGWQHYVDMRTSEPRSARLRSMAETVLSDGQARSEAMALAERGRTTIALAASSLKKICRG